MNRRTRDDGWHADPADVRSVRRWPAPGVADRPPDISVLIPCFRAEPHIATALASVAAQTGLPSGSAIEAVIVSDGRESDAREVHGLIGAGANPYPFAIVLVELARNLGAGAARCHGWRHCRGELVAFLDDDDVWHPAKLALQWRLHRDHPAQIASGHLYRARLDPPAIVAAAARPVTFGNLLVRTHLAMPTLMVRRRLWPRGPEPYRLGDDALLKAMIARAQPILELPHVLAAPAPDAAPFLTDADSLARQRWQSRRAEWRNYWLLVRRGGLSPWLLAPVMSLSLARFACRLVLDAVWRIRHARPPM